MRGFLGAFVAVLFAVLSRAADGSEKAEVLTAAQIAAYEGNGAPAQAVGVVRSVVPDAVDARYNWMTLADETGTFNVSVPTESESLESLTALIDAEVRCRGVVYPNAGWRAGVPPYLSQEPGVSFEVVVPAPGDDEVEPMRSRKIRLHRVKASGRVLASCGEELFLESRGKRRRVRLQRGERTPRSGDRIEVRGFMSPDAFDPMLDSATVRTVGRETAADDVVAAFASPADLFKTNSPPGRGIVRLSRRIVRLTGLVSRGPGKDAASALYLEGSGRYVKVVDAATGEPLPEGFAPGAVAEVTGMLEIEFDPPRFSNANPMLRGVLLYPRTTEDLKVVRPAPWWTPDRFWSVIGILAFVVVWFTVWIAVLAVRSERRGRELARSQLSRNRAKMKVEERTRLAVELHDSISQTLTGVSLHLDTACSLTAAEAKAMRFLVSARQLLANARQELQCCLWDLRTRTFDEKVMGEAVERAIEPVLGEAVARIRFNVPRKVFSDTTAHALLKVVRELVANAVNHGGAKKVRIAGEYEDGKVLFSVADDGCGFDPATAPGAREGHFGIAGARERLAEFGGSLRFETAPGRGTTVRGEMLVTTGEDENG